MLVCPYVRLYLCMCVYPYVRLSVRPSIRPSVYGPFAVFVFVLISIVGVQSCDACIPTLGSKGSQWGPVNIMYRSLRISVQSSASLFVYYFRPSMRLSVRPSARGTFAIFLLVLISSVGVQRCKSFISLHQIYPCVSHTKDIPCVNTRVHENQ